MHVHFVNDSDEHSPLRKRFPIQGRVYVNFGAQARRSLCLSYNLFSSFCHIEARAEHGNELTFGIAVPPLSLWLSFEGFFRWNYKKDWETEFSIHHWTLWWKFFADPWGWDSKTPRWRHGSFDFADFFLGRHVYSELVLEERDVLVPMPEKSYPAHAILSEDSWKRPRWFTRRIKRIKLDLEEGIPHAGKGENSWDCGDDASFGFACPADTIAEGVGKFVGSCLRSRVKYGGWDDWTWKREPFHRAAATSQGQDAPSAQLGESHGTI